MSDTKPAMGSNEYLFPIPDIDDLGRGRMTANDLHEYYDRLSDMGRKRTVKVELFAEMIREFEPVDCYVVFRQFCETFPHPDRSLNLSTNRIDEAVAEVYFDGDTEHVTEQRNEHGGLSQWLNDNDIGQDPEDADDGMLVTELYATLEKIAETGGEQSKTEMIRSTIEKMEHPWVFTQMCGRDATFYVGSYMYLDAITEHCGYSNDTLKEAWKVCADSPTVFLDWARSDREVTTELQPHARLRGMKAENDYEPSDIPELQESGEWVAQTKYDGARVLVQHSGDGDVRAYLAGRKEGGCKDVTAVLPELDDIDWPDCPFIFDAEATPYDKESGDVKPFQNILRRIGRRPDEKLDTDEVTTDLEVRFKFFDCLVWHGKDIRDRKFTDRFSVVKNNFLPPRVAATGEDLEATFHRSLDEGHEGLVMKTKDHEYQLSTRSADWQKWKAQPETLDVVVTDAYRGGGRISDGVGSLHLAVKHDGELVNIGSVGTGFSDDERRELWKQHEASLLEGTLIEVAFEELQRGGGDDLDTSWALRFPSYNHKRPDGEVDTLRRAAELDGKEDEFEEWLSSHASA